MAKIETYTVAVSPISGSDKLIGTDSAHDNATKNFTVSELANFINGGYLVYTALLNQEDDADPVATVLQNTLGTIEWYRDSQGYYYAYSPDSLFTVDSTFVITTYSNYWAEGTIAFWTDDPQNIYINTLDTNFSYQDDLMYNTPIEIRVYPATP
jgi:hypothetical protein